MNAVHLCAQSREGLVRHDDPIGLVLEFADHLLIPIAVQRVILGIVNGVELLRHASHICV